MAGLKFIKSGDAKGTRVNVDLPAGRWAFLKITLIGTSDTGQALTLADLGNYRIERNGRQIHGEDMRFLSEYADLKNGHPTFVAPTAGATRVALYVPFSVPAQPNTLDLASKEEADLTLEFGSNLSTIFGSNDFTYEVLAYSAPSVPETYELQISQQDVRASGATRENEVLNKQNIAALYLRDTDSVVDQIQLITDGETIVDNVSDDDIRDIANLFNQVEAAQDLAEINLLASGNILEASNNNSQLEANFSGAGEMGVTVLSINFDSEGIERSAADVERRTRQKISQLQASNARGILRGTPAGAVRNPNARG